MGVYVPNGKNRLQQRKASEGGSKRSVKCESANRNKELLSRKLIEEYFDFFDQNKDNELSLNDVLDFLKRIAPKKQKGCVTI